MTTSPGPWLADTMHGLPCRVLLPEPYEPDARRYPLVLALHGSMERGDDNVSQLRNGVQSFASSAFRRRHPCIVVAPQAPRGATFGGNWYGGRTPLQDTLVALVRELAGRRSVDADRVYGVGFSMGAIGLWDLVKRHAELFAAIVPLAGDVDVDDDSIAALAPVNVWAVHGADDTLVSPDHARAVLHRLLPGGRARWTELAGVGHDVWPAAYAHEPLWDWLFSQRRNV